jgi:hypothetical protein
MLFKDPAHDRTLYFDDPALFGKSTVACALWIVGYGVFHLGYLTYLERDSPVAIFAICIALSAVTIGAGILLLGFKRFSAVHHRDCKITTGWMFLGTELLRRDDAFGDFECVRIHSRVAQRDNRRVIYCFHVLAVLKGGHLGRLILMSNRYEKATLVAKRIAEELNLPVEDKRLAEADVSAQRDLVPNPGGSAWFARPPARLHLSTALILAILSGLEMPFVIAAFQSRAKLAPLVLLLAIIVVVVAGIIIEGYMIRRDYPRPNQDEPQP